MQLFVFSASFWLSGKAVVTLGVIQLHTLHQRQWDRTLLLHVRAFEYVPLSPLYVVNGEGLYVCVYVAIITRRTLPAAKMLYTCVCTPCVEAYVHILHMQACQRVLVYAQICV